MTLKWNAYILDRNKQKIKSYNIFDHSRFMHDVESLIEEFGLAYNLGTSKKQFAEKIKRILLYYYGYKVEWEIGITEPFPTISNAELDRLNSETSFYRYHPRLEVDEKVDVYQQVMLNWEHFIDYLWERVDK